MSTDPVEAALAQVAGSGATSTAPRAVRNNNPGNIVADSRNPWQGQVGTDGRFAVFATPADGDRAHAKLLSNYQNLHGANTVRSVISRWAPPSENNTDAYVGRMSSDLGIGPDDPIDLNDPATNEAFRRAQRPIEAGGGDPNAVQGGTAAPAADANDPIEAALSGVARAGDGRPVSTAPSGNLGGGSGGPASANGGSDSGVGGSGLPGLASSIGEGIQSLNPIANLIRNGPRGLQDAAAGQLNALTALPETALNIAGQKGAADWLEKTTSGLANDPNSAVYNANRLASEVGQTLPLSEIKLLEAVPALSQGGKLAVALARYGDMGAQGAAAGAALSRGKNIGHAAALGAALGAGGGATIDALGPQVVKAIDAVAGSKLGQALKNYLPKAEEAAPAATSQTIAKGSALDDVPEGATNIERDGDGHVIGYRDANGRLNVNVSGPAPISPEALGSRGARTGIEAHDQMPPEVAAHYKALTDQGVAPDEALREADIRANGGSPTAATVTRNPAMMQAEKEGAKASSAEGQALNTQAAENNQALHTTAQGLVSDLGGAPAPGEAIQSAAESLKAASDTDRSAVRAAYKAADEEAAAKAGATDAASQKARDDHAQLVDELKAAAAARDSRLVQGGGTPGRPPVLPAAPTPEPAPGYIDLSSVRSALHTPQLANPTVEGGKTMRSGVLGLMDAFGRKGDMYTANEAEQIRQAIGDAYDPMGGSINHHIGNLKSVVDTAMDGAEGGASYKAARALHKAWADRYDNPAGIAKLIKTDARGDLVKDDNWRSVENMIAGKSDKEVLQIVKQLKANGDTESLNKLKASIVQDAYEKATGRNAGTAADQLGNSTFSGSQFHARLNAIGMKKLEALFEPEEIARLASLGRAGVAINEAVPGTVNTSHTASAFENAQERLKGKAAGKLGPLTDVVMGLGSPLVGAVLHGMEGGAIGGGFGGAATAARHGVAALVEGAAQRKAANDLGEALRTLSSPQATRAADRAAAQRLADGLRRRTAARAAGQLTAPAVAGANEGRR